MDNDTGGLMAPGPTESSAPTGRFVQVAEDGSPVPQVVTVNLPSDVVARLDDAAWRNREDCSGITQAVVEWLDRHSAAT